MSEFIIHVYKMVKKCLQVHILISTQNVESAATPTPAATTTMSGFYLLPESDLFGCEIWICSLFYLYM